MRILGWVRDSILFLPLLSTEPPKLNANQIPLIEKDKTTLVKDKLESPPVNDSRALFEARDNINPNLLVAAVGDPERDFTQEKLKKEVEDRWFGYKWYRGAKLRLSNADQIRYAYKHCDLSLQDYRKLFVR